MKKIIKNTEYGITNHLKTTEKYYTMTDEEIENLNDEIEMTIAYISKYGIDMQYPYDDEVKYMTVKFLKELKNINDYGNKNIQHDGSFLDDLYLEFFVRLKKVVLFDMWGILFFTPIILSIFYSWWFSMAYIVLLPFTIIFILYHLKYMEVEEKDE
jgi:hypothetical protein